MQRPGVPGGVCLGLELDGMLEFESGSPAPAIQLNSISTPEPVSIILLATGLLVLGLRRASTKRRKPGTV